ncbi:MAG: murein biosynthesis integral membrane protein MurJ [Pseudomonadota bacterium]
MRRIRLAAAFLTVGGWTLASRILGFARDILIAATLGAGPVAEAFVVAFALPNMFRRFFAEGAFNMAFVPMYAKRLETGEDPHGFAAEALAALASVLLVLTLIAQLAMPWLVLAMAGGFAGDERWPLATMLGRIVFPYILLISLAALFSGLLNATGRFWAAAAAPVLLNVILIAAMGVAVSLGWDLGLALGWGVVLAGIAQLALVWTAARAAGIAPALRRPRLTPAMRRLAIVALPAALAGGVVQINLLVGRQVASFFDGAVVWLSFADRLYQLPLGVVGIAIGVVLLPDLARRLGAGDGAGGRAAFNRAMEFAMALSLPAAAALMVIALPLTSVLFERFAFTAADSAATALAVAVYGAGLPAFVAQKVISPVFFAREDTVRPFRYALVGMAVNAGLAIGLAPVLGYIAAAIATSAAGWINAGLLWWGARRYGDAAALDPRARRSLPRLLIASAVMAAVIFGLAEALAGALATPGWRILALAALVAAGAAVYGAAALGLGALRLGDLRRAVARRGDGAAAAELGE